MTIGANAGSVYAQETPDAVAVSVKGRALVRQGKNGKARSLKNRENLFAGQQVLCDNACIELKISYCNIARPLAKSPKWKSIYAMNCNAADGERAGAEKGGKTTILSPYEFETVQPERFYLRWNPESKIAKFDITVKVYLGEEIWNQRNVDGKAGFFESPALRERLKQVQKEDELYFVIILSRSTDTQEPLNIEDNPSYAVVFKVISLKQEKVLEGKLNQLEGETEPVFKALGRGLALSEAGLYRDAAREIEKILPISSDKKDPESQKSTLVRLAIRANYQNYNDTRVKQLCELLKGDATALPTQCVKSSH